MNPRALRPWVTGLGLAAFLSVCVLVYARYGLIRVPPGMDTMPLTQPPGTLCLVQKRPSSVVAGRSVVFLDVARGGTLLTRVVGITEDGRLRVRNDNRHSVFRALEDETYELRDVRGLVLTTLAPGRPMESEHGK